ncbi:T9SS type A sorting domain-containing protein [Candidatus Brachybacter algidus]|uniref:T9SS type A sorting domain-containing protein n=1 Tax=Candidatus Brachybacter algidus TaxID=2982024 RepID=UPI001E0EC813|nr:T9SS type A sorting domain-containing protein [Candidatus Brachybacter algidus]MBK6449453.1 T9SS type A sorting domain-containing protein [Candidatus Brachybacter algidus]
MKKYLLFLFFLIPQMTYSQHYVNKIIPTTFGNINATNIYLFNGQYVVQGIFGNNQSCIFDISQDLSTSQHYIYDSTVFSRAPFNIIDNKIFAFSKNRFLGKGLEILNFNNKYEIISKKNIETLGDYNFPTSSINNGSFLYNSFFYLQNNVYKFGLNKISLDGQTQWTRSFETQSKYIYPWDINYSLSHHILTSYSIAYEGIFGTFARVLKVDTMGIEVWKSDTLMNVESGGAAVWMTELSDSNIFLTYKVNKFFDPEFFNLHPYPPTYIWLDKNGKKVKELVLKIDHDNEVYISELKSGKGDYFYVYGQLTIYNDDHFNDFYGFITKYANNGDTIWTHTYRHPSYNQEDYFHYINDLIEEDNGDLTVLGSIAPIGGKNEVWVFRVNSEGCFGTDSCYQFTLGDHDVIKPDAIEISCYPNPTKGIVTLTGLPVSVTYNIQIYSIGGWLMDSYKERNPSNIDLGHLDSGVYVIQISDKKITYTLKVVKQ